MVFKHLSKRYRHKNNDNKIFLGATEAEAEALPDSRIQLSKVFKDYHDLIGSLSNEKFIIAGRKGSGKSAFAEFISIMAQKEANIFCKFVRQSDVNLEQIVQIGKEHGHSIDRENLYKWLILSNILSLFSSNQAIANNKDYNLLKQFLAKNSGYIDIRESEITEIVKKQGFELKIEYLKRYWKSKHNGDIQIRQQKAPFYKLIPHLREVILKVLSSDDEKNNGNSYILFFDDLDISFHKDNDASVKSLVSLLRISKEINNEFFAKNGVKAKVVLLIRDDIRNTIANRHADTAKIFTSYSSNVQWYQDEYHQSDDEASLYIRQFINTRISYAFRAENLSFDEDDPWLSLVQDPFEDTPQLNAHKKSSFKYILDHTLIRPRDLLLFFKPLAERAYQVPLSRHDINHLIGLYSVEMITELKNELSIFYSDQQIFMIFNALGEIFLACKESENNSCPHSKAKTLIQDNCVGINPIILLEDLFQRSIIGNINESRHVFFKYRQPATESYNYNHELAVILHGAVKVYLTKKSYA